MQGQTDPLWSFAAILSTATAVMAAGRADRRYSAAHTAVRVEEYCFDYLVYPYMLYVGGPSAVNVLFGAVTALPWGYWGGFAAMLVASLFLNILYLRLYDRSEQDWFGFERARRWAPVQRALEHRQ